MYTEALEVIKLILKLSAARQLHKKKYIYIYNTNIYIYNTNLQRVIKINGNVYLGYVFVYPFQNIFMYMHCDAIRSEQFENDTFHGPITYEPQVIRQVLNKR